MTKKKASIFKRGEIGFSILIFSFVYIFLIGSFLSPFIFVDNYNVVFAIVITSILTVAYIGTIIYLVIYYKKKK